MSVQLSYYENNFIRDIRMFLTNVTNVVIM